MASNSVMKPKGVNRFDTEQARLARAKTLAVFCNLKRGGIKQFKKEHPGFFPDSWWSYRPDSVYGNPSKDMQWEVVQNQLRDAWHRQFNIPLVQFTFFLLNSVFDSTEMVWTKDEPKPTIIRDDRAFDLETYPYHEAVQWMVGQGWRARQCKQCEKYIVAETSQQQYCPMGDGASCFWAHRKADRKNNADEVNSYRRNNYDPKARRRRYLRDKMRNA